MVLDIYRYLCLLPKSFRVGTLGGHVGFFHNKSMLTLRLFSECGLDPNKKETKKIIVLTWFVYYDGTFKIIS